MPTKKGSSLRAVEAKFAKLAKKSRKHPAYWQALAKLEYDEVRFERNRMRRFLRSVLNDIHNTDAQWVSLDRVEIEDALGIQRRNVR